MVLVVSRSGIEYFVVEGMKTKDVELYRRFIRTTNFVHWFRSKKKAAEEAIFHKYLQCFDSSPAALSVHLAGKSEVAIVDCLLKVKHYYLQILGYLGSATATSDPEHQPQVFY